MFYGFSFNFSSLIDFQSIVASLSCNASAAGKTEKSPMDRISGINAKVIFWFNKDKNFKLHIKNMLIFKIISPNHI